MERADKRPWLGIGTVLAALGASVCCILPVVVAVLGFGSAALGATLEPIRPYFIGLTAVLLGVAFFQEYRTDNACAPGQSCQLPESRHRQRLALWTIAILAALLVTFPYYVGWIL